MKRLESVLPLIFDLYLGLLGKKMINQTKPLANSLESRLPGKSTNDICQQKDEGESLSVSYFSRL